MGDLDGDADADLAVTNEGSDNVSVLLNTTARTGGGTVAAPPPAGPPAGAAPPPGSAAPAQPAITELRLGSRCVRRSRSGRVRVPMTLRMTRLAPLHVRIDRATATKGRRGCTRRQRGRGRYRKVVTLRYVETRPAADGRRRLTLRRRLAPGLYRITVRAHIDSSRLSRPVRRYLRVVR